MGDMPIRCLVDLDGVVVRWLPPFRGHIMRAGCGGDNLPDPKTYHFHDSWGLDAERFELELLAFGEDGGWAKPEPYDDGIEMVRELAEAGCWVGLATMRARSARVIADTLGWVSRQELLVDSVGVGRSAKFEVDVDLVFDDCPDVIRALDEMGECVPLLIDRPWNRLEELGRVRADEVAPLVAALDGMLDLSTLHPAERQEALREGLAELEVL